MKILNKRFIKPIILIQCTCEIKDDRFDLWILFYFQVYFLTRCAPVTLGDDS